jgi:hypothetical protein
MDNQGIQQVKDIQYVAGKFCRFYHPLGSCSPNILHIDLMTIQLSQMQDLIRQICLR